MKTKSINVTMEVTDYFLEQMRTLFDLEILQGSHSITADGLHKKEFTVTGEKAAMFEDFVKQLMSLKTTDVKVKFMGLPISPN